MLSSEVGCLLCEEEEGGPSQGGGVKAGQEQTHAHAGSLINREIVLHSPCSPEPPPQTGADPSFPNLISASLT